MADFFSEIGQLFVIAHTASEAVLQFYPLLSVRYIL